jgi:hypothetical protein
MCYGGCGAGEEQTKAAAGSSEDARMAQNSHHAEQEKCAGDEQEFGLLEGYETGNQDPGGNGSQGTKQWIFQGRLIVAGKRC